MLTARFHDSLDDIDPVAWDALVADANPFVAHAFLAGLERHGCIHAEYGWSAHHLGLYDTTGTLLAAAPLYLKGNSHGEYVFDWSWASAWQRAGGEYYPKLLCAVPYSPVPGPRLLAGCGDDCASLQMQLGAAIVEETLRLGLSSAHIDFLASANNEACDDAWLPRFDWQFHWHNRGYRDFEDFLDALKHKKRKNIRHERAQIARSGVDCAMVAGDKLDADAWRTVHALYLATFSEKGNHATLTAAFFQHLAAQFGARMQVALARRDEHIVAMALFVRGGDTLYGRYWGCRETIPALHFELCYYQGIQYCIKERIAHLAPGAQGEHKLARGFMPTRTHSRHYIVNPGFRVAIAHALAREMPALDAYHASLLLHSPYAHEPAAACPTKPGSNRP